MGYVVIVAEGLSCAGKRGQIIGNNVYPRTHDDRVERQTFIFTLSTQLQWCERLSDNTIPDVANLSQIRAGALPKHASILFILSTVPYPCLYITYSYSIHVETLKINNYILYNNKNVFSTLVHASDPVTTT